jgi:hypothetical protein
LFISPVGICHTSAPYIKIGLLTEK